MEPPIQPIASPAPEAATLSARWLATALCAQPADRVGAEEAVRAAYRHINLPGPATIEWHPSPLAGTQAHHQRLREHVQSGAPVSPGAIGAHLRTLDLTEPTSMAGRDDLIQAVTRIQRLCDLTVDQVAEDGIGSFAWTAIRSEHYQYAGDDTHQAAGPPIADVIRHAGWWFPEPGWTILTERPSHLAFDTQGRPHDETGPAVLYPDGWGVYAWHGTRVPAWVIHAPTIANIAAEGNAEVRRCAIEQLGWDRFVTDARLRLVDQCQDPGNPGCELALYDVPNRVWGDNVRLLLCTNGTPERDGTRHRFGLTVPPGTASALSAAGWGYGLTGAEYALTIRRT